MWTEVVMASFRILTDRVCAWRGLEVGGESQLHIVCPI